MLNKFRFLCLLSILVGATCLVPHGPSLADERSLLTVIITPQRAIDDGGKWRVVINKVPSQWHISGEKIVGIVDGDVVVEGNEPLNSPCKKPNNDIVEIRPGKAHLRSLDFSAEGCR